MTDAMLYVMASVETWKAAAREALENGERGQGMVEYGLILALVSIAAIVILGTLGTNVTSVFTRVSNAVSTP